MTTNKDNIDFYLEFISLIDNALQSPSPDVRAFALAFKRFSGVLGKFALDIVDIKESDNDDK